MIPELVRVGDKELAITEAEIDVGIAMLFVVIVKSLPAFILARSSIEALLKLLFNDSLDKLLTFNVELFPAMIEPEFNKWAVGALIVKLVPAKIVEFDARPESFPKRRLRVSSER